MSGEYIPKDSEVRVYARIIYDAVYLPGVVDDGAIMPPFEEAEARGLGDGSGP